MLLSTYAKTYLDGLVRKILDYSQARESRIHAHIDVVAHEAEEMRENHERSHNNKGEDHRRSEINRR